MHILSKVFVVFAAILSVLLSALTIAYASNSGRLVSEYRTASDRADSASAALQLERSQSSERAGVLNTQIAALQGQIDGLTDQLAALQGERAQSQSLLQQAIASRDALQANIAQFRQTSETQTNLIAEFRRELTTLRDNELAFRRQRIQLEDRISDLESQNEVLTQTNRSLQESVAQLQEQLRGAGVSTTIGSNTGREVSGRVSRVTSDSRTGAQLVEIGLGANDGLRIGSRVTIQRPGVWVANAEVIRVELQSAVAEVREMNRSGQTLQQGDQVTVRN